MTYDYKTPINEAIAERVSRMPPHQQRVVAEKADLDEKIAGLKTFVDGPFFQTIEAAEQMRLVEQLTTMQHYSRILGERIAEFF